MDPQIMTTISTLVGSLGFPIVCCGMLFWQQNKTMSEFATRMETAINVLNKTLETNTTAVTTLVTTVETIVRVGAKDG